MGVPAHRTSMPVVCPLHSGVSRQTSAIWPLRTCSSLGATLEKMKRAGAMPWTAARNCRLISPMAGKRSNHITLLGTLFRICNTNQVCHHQHNEKRAPVRQQHTQNRATNVCRYVIEREIVLHTQNHAPAYVKSGFRQGTWVCRYVMRRRQNFAHHSRLKF